MYFFCLAAFSQYEAYKIHSSCCINCLFPSTAVYYLQIYHNLSMVLDLSLANEYFGAFQFFIITSKSAMNVFKFFKIIIIFF